MQEVASYPVDWLLRTCNIVLGEIEAGHLITTTSDQLKRDDYDRFINEKYLPLSLKVSTTTRLYYGQIVARIFQKYPFSSHKTKTERYLVELSVDINDVWIVAIAWEHNLTVLTTDRMEKIREAVGNDVQFDCWL
jgi:predicted nucleic acid-binding protein